MKMNEEEYLKWLNSKGYSFANVKCAKCGKEMEVVLANVDKERALKHDNFLCENETLYPCWMQLWKKGEDRDLCRRNSKGKRKPPQQR